LAAIKTASVEVDYRAYAGNRRDRFAQHPGAKGILANSTTGKLDGNFSIDADVFAGCFVG
jgi:hypothetical protein